MLAHVAKGLAFAFLAGPWTEAELVARGRLALGVRGRARWMRGLVRRLLVAFPAAPIDRDDDLIAALRDDRALHPHFRGPNETTHIPEHPRRWLIPEATMVPVAGPPATFKVFAIPSHDVLARCLDVTADELAWFADLRHMNAVRAPSPALAHYHHRWVAKAPGGWRLLEEPKPRMKRIQRWLLRNVLAPIPVSDVAHGFVPGRGVRTFVAPHVGRAVVVRMDLQDFFPSVSRAHVTALLRRVGYPRRVAAAIAGLCTAPTPDTVLAAHPRQGTDLTRRFLANQRLRDPHLPQGAPTSPALSNLAAWRLDRRLAGLAAAFGATMTRYADDLAFAGDETFAKSLRFFPHQPPQDPRHAPRPPPATLRRRHQRPHEPPPPRTRPPARDPPQRREARVGEPEPGGASRVPAAPRGKGRVGGGAESRVWRARI